MDVDSIKQKIVQDKAKSTSSYRRYPVRFLFMELNNSTQSDIKNLVKSVDGDLLDLSDYIMKKDDGWITKSKFVRIIKENTSRTKDTFVLGFSELIRFFSKEELESTVLSLFDIENSDIMDEKYARRRIFLICFSMMDNVYKVLQNSFTRKDLIDPFINSDYELSGEYRKVCFVSSDYADKINRNKITSSEEWIGLWRSSEIIDFSSPIWCCSESLYEWHQKAAPDNAFQIDVVRNTKNYIEKAYDTILDFPYVESEADYWNQLNTEYSKVGSGKSLQDIAGHMLGIDIKSTSAMAGKWLTTDSKYDKWFIRCYILAYFPDSFLARILRTLKTNSKKEFLISIWQQGYWVNNIDMLEERVTIIKELNKYAGSFTPEKEIQDVIYDGMSKVLCISAEGVEGISRLHSFELWKKAGVKFENIRDGLWSYYIETFKPAFTGMSNTEKEFVINLYSNDVIDKTEIKDVYPLLYFYLFGQGENRIADKDEWKYYLQAYRESKVADADNPYLREYYLTGCANSANFYNMYYTLQRQESAVAPYLNNADLYVFDGVGAEYLPLMVEIIKQNGYDVEFCDYAACHLPSITDVNKDYFSSLNYHEWFVDFDREVIHGDFYKIAANLRKAFDILESKIKEIVAESSGRRFIITADHGATARAHWTDVKKKYDFSSSDHEGRCCKLSSKNDYEDTTDYIIYEDEIKPGMPYAISLNATSLYNRPRYEDHGGATIEEVLVPVIVAIPHSNVSTILYKAIGDKLEVSGLDRKVSFAIVPTPEEEAYIIEADLTKHVLKKENGVYSANLDSGKEQDIIVVVNDKKYRFHTINNAKKNMEGDDGFDD